VEILDGPVYDGGLAWHQVSAGGVVGWCAGEWLLSPAADRSGGVLVGERAIIHGTDGQDVRIRDGIGVGAPIVGFGPEDRVVLVVNGPMWDDQGAAWYGIDYDGLQGWVFGGYLRWSSAARSERVGVAPYDPERGEALAMEALSQLDVPYVWGGDSPGGWDCSGLVQWLYAVVAGIELPRVSQDQFFAGTPLSRGEIRPGDIVFFADTDGHGITHNGIAIGGGRFIHARDEARGTMISSLDEPRFVEHYAGARRP
jgi:cell wall-associated NlpC family hydrolase